MDLRRLIGSRPIIMAGSCVIVRNKEGQILLQKRRDTDDWGTIGGSLELGESFEEAAARELYEEAGLKANKFNFIKLLSGKDMYFQYPHGDEVYNAMAVFEAEEIEGIPTINDDEGLELKYFSPEHPIPGINPFSELTLKKSGYINHN